METAEIFSSSKEKQGLYYISFYGDVDSKAYPAVKHIYGPSKPIKVFECVVSLRGNLKKKITKKYWEGKENSLILK